MNNLAPMKICPGGGVQGNLNWMPGYRSEVKITVTLNGMYDTTPSQDAFRHQIWNSYLKEYRRYAPDTKRDGRTNGRTDRQCDYYMPPKVPLGA